MSSMFLKSAVFSVSLLALPALPWPAHAQGTAPTGPAQSAASKPKATGLQQVVVTAQFSRQQQLQRVPLAVTAVTGTQLTERGITNLADLGASQIAPNVNITPGPSALGNNTLQVFIRGVGQSDFKLTFQPGVAIYLNNVYLGPTFGSDASLFDVQRIEVLRGPQGTLFGKNSIGGAIRIVTRKPRGSNTGFIQGTYGDYNRMDFKGGYDLKLTRNLFLGASFMSQSRKGYVKRIDYACAHPDLGASQGYPVNPSAPRLLQSQALGLGNCVLGREGGKDDKGGRVELRWLASKSVQVDVAGYAEYDDDGPGPSNLLAVDMNTSPLLQGMNQQFLNTYGVMLDGRFIPSNPDENYATFQNLDRGSTLPSGSVVHIQGGTATVDWDINPSMHLKSITAYRHWVGHFADDQDDSPLPLTSVFEDMRYRQWTQELQLTGTTLVPLLAHRPLDYALGVYYFDAVEGNRGQIFLNYVFHSLFTVNDSADLIDRAAFSQFTLHATRSLSLTAGVRYTMEQNDQTIDHEAVSGVINIPTSLADKRSDFVDWKAGLRYQFTPNLMAYVTATTGHKGGGANPRPFTPAQFLPFGPEKLTTEEVGLKSEWFNHRLRVNVDGYYSQYRDLQINTNAVDKTGTAFFGIFNVGTAHIKGLEAEIDAEPVEDLLLQASAGYEDFSYTSLGTNIGCQVLPKSKRKPGTNCVTGNPGLDDQPVFTPRWNGSFGVQYTIRMPHNLGALIPRLDMSYRSSEFGDVVNVPNSVANLPSLTLLNAHVSWSNPVPGWTVTFEVTNLADHQYEVNTFDRVVSGQGTITGQPGPPREWAVTIRRDF